MFKKLLISTSSLILASLFADCSAVMAEPAPSTKAAPSAPQAVRHMPPMGMMMPMMMPGECPMAATLKLTDEQYSKLWTLKDEYLDKKEVKEAQLRTARRHLTMALTSESVDSAKVKEIEDQVVSAVSDMTKLKMDHYVDAMNVLTPEQRKMTNHFIFWSMMEPSMFDGGKPHHH